MQADASSDGGEPTDESSDGESNASQKKASGSEDSDEEQLSKKAEKTKVRTPFPVLSQRAQAACMHHGGGWLQCESPTRRCVHASDWLPFEITLSCSCCNCGGEYSFLGCVACMSEYKFIYRDVCTSSILTGGASVSLVVFITRNVGAIASGVSRLQFSSNLYPLFLLMLFLG